MDIFSNKKKIKHLNALRLYFDMVFAAGKICLYLLYVLTHNHFTKNFIKTTLINNPYTKNGLCIFLIKCIVRFINVSRTNGVFRDQPIHL